MTSGRLAVALGLGAAMGALLAAPAPVQAGGCPVCESEADCPNGFCVIHDSDVGCGGELQLCCPGQGCGIDGSGRPSCETAGTCMVIERGCGCRVVGGSGGAAPGGAGPAALVVLAGVIGLRQRGRLRRLTVPCRPGGVPGVRQGGRGSGRIPE